MLAAIRRASRAKALAFEKLARRRKGAQAVAQAVILPNSGGALSRVFSGSSKLVTRLNATIKF